MGDLDLLLIDVRIASVKQARRMGLPREDADDAAQDVCLRALGHLRSGKHLSNPSAWAKRVTRNYVLDGKRSASSLKRGGGLLEQLDEKTESKINFTQ